MKKWQRKYVEAAKLGDIKTIRKLLWKRLEKFLAELKKTKGVV